MGLLIMTESVLGSFGFLRGFCKRGSVGSTRVIGTQVSRNHVSSIGLEHELHYRPTGDRRAAPAAPARLQIQIHEVLGII